MKIIMRSIIIIILLLFVVSYNLFGGWGSIITIDTTEDLRGIGYDPVNKIIRDGAGNLFVTYRKKYNDGLGNIYQNYVSYSMDEGNTWNILGDEGGNGPLQIVGRGAGNEGYNQRVASIAIDNNGVIHCVWYGKDKYNTGTNERQIKYSKFINQDWTDWKNIAPVSGYNSGDYWQEHPMIAVGKTGNLYVVWEGRDESNTNYQQIKFAKSVDNGNSWVTFPNGKKWKNITGIGADNSTNVDLYSRTQSRPMIIPIYSSTIGNDILYVLWYGGNSGTAQQIKLSYSKDLGDTWSAYYNIGQQDSGLNAYVQKSLDAAFDSSGNLHIVWCGQDSSSSTYYWLKYTKGADSNSNGFIEKNEWTKWTNLAPPPSDYHQEHPSITIDIHTNIHIVWQEEYKYFGSDIVNIADSKIYYIMKTNNGEWGAKQLISGTKNINIYPYFRWSNYNMNGGYLDVVWLEGDDKYGPFDIVYRKNSDYELPAQGGVSVSFEIYPEAEELGVEEGEITAYPNPVDFSMHSSINFLINFKKGEVVKKVLYIFNLAGNIIYKEVIDKNYLIDKPFKWNGETIDGEKVKNGIYFYCIEVEYITGRKEKSDIEEFFVR